MKRKQLVVAVATTAFAAIAMSGCSAGGSTGVPQDDKAPITVWVDDTRTQPAQDYAAAHPELNAKIESIDNTQGAVSARIALATKAGDAVPDVVFLSTPDEISTLLANPVNYPLALTGAVDQSVLDGFAAGSVDRCTYDGKAYCFPNDIAQTVLYYNKTLFDEFGYTVPTTFDEWLALGEKLATEHPGYSLGTINSRYGLDAYFGSSQCLYNQAANATEVKIDTSATECMRVADVIGPLVANGTLSTLDPFDPAFTPIVTDGKLLATISPSWMGEYGIKPNFTTEGQFAVAPMPTWAGASENYSGAVGGGIWVVSSSSKNQAAAIAFATAMSTDVSIQSVASTYPADTASAAKWLGKVSADPWYAEDPSEALKEAAGKVSTTLGYVRYQTQLLDIYNSTIGADAGTDIEGALKAFGEQATSAATAAGYTVSP